MQDPAPPLYAAPADPFFKAPAARYPDARYAADLSPKPPAVAFAFAPPFPPPQHMPAPPFGAGEPGPPTAMKQRRVSLAVPPSERIVPAWSFRDDTTLDKHVAETSHTPRLGAGPRAERTRRDKLRTVDVMFADDGEEEMKPPPTPGSGYYGSAALPELAPKATEKRLRKKWTKEETQMLVDGCNKYGVGNWKAMLKDETLKFDHRSAVDLKDRFRTYFPDAYKQHYPNAKTHLSSKVRSTLPDGSSIFEKTRSKKRRPFTAEEDRALQAGYEKHGTIWAAIVKDPVFRAQNRKSTDLRDRFRNAFPELYQAAGYKPRNSAKKKIVAPAMPIRAATDDQLPGRPAGGPVRRRRALTTDGLYRGGTKSVPDSTTNSEDEDSSGGEDDDFMSQPILLSNDPQMAASHSASISASSSSDALPGTHDHMAEVDMQGVDSLADSLSGPDYVHHSSQSLSELTDSSQSHWSSGLDTPLHTHSWSSAATAASPTSSHVSDYFPQQSPLNRRADGMTLIGKSAWGTQDWLSANPRLGVDGPGTASSASSSYAGGGGGAGSFSPVPSSPYSFHSLSHGVFDRYDLPSLGAHDYSSEVGVGDTHSAFSDPEMFQPSSFRGFTHHSTYAGDLIFGARTHQPLQAGSGYGFGFGMGPTPAMGLGLSGVSQTTGIHPMQLHSHAHTPGLPGIDEIELTSINLNDPPDVSQDAMEAVMADAHAHQHAHGHGHPHGHGHGHGQDGSGAADVSLPIPEDLGFMMAPTKTESLEGAVDMALTHEPEQEQEMHATPPATPVKTGRRLRRTDAASHSPSTHNRSMSVPPSEYRSGLAAPGMEVPRPPLTPTRSLSLLDTVAHWTHQADEPNPNPGVHPSDVLAGVHTHSPNAQDASRVSQLQSQGQSQHPYGLSFLDLHYYKSGGAVGFGAGDFDGHGMDGPGHAQLGQADALDLAVDGGAGSSSRPFHEAVGLHFPQEHQFSYPMPPPPVPASRQSLHHRGQSAVSPQDLQLRNPPENRRKRASWDGQPAS